MCPRSSRICGPFRSIRRGRARFAHIQPGSDREERSDEAKRGLDAGGGLALQKAVCPGCDLCERDLVACLAVRSGLAARLHLCNVPLIGAAQRFAQEGYNTGAGTRNREAFGADIDMPRDLEEWRRNLLYDPQTSGGLLVAVAPDEAERVLGLFLEQGYAAASIIGTMEDGTPNIAVVP